MPGTARLPGRFVSQRLGRGLALGGVLVIALLPLLLGTGSTGTAPVGSSAGAPVPGNQYPSTCPFPASDTTGTRNVSLAAPTFPLSKADTVTVRYEFAISSVTNRSASLRVTVPSLTAKFPLTNGSRLDLFLPPRTLFLNGTSWSSPSLANTSKTIAQPTRFANGPAFMTTELLSVMANASYQTVTLVFRWDWSVTFAANGSTVSSPWSRVATTGPRPTTFDPAPYVQLVSTTNRTLDIGSEFTAYLSGAVTHTLFHSVLEFASTGREIRNDETVLGAGATPPVGVHVLIIPYRQPLGPTVLLDHVRDYCLALLYSISLNVVYAPSANVTVRAWPSRCGPVEFNGTWHASGTVVNVGPSPNPVPIAVGGCPGKSFHGWARADGVWVANTATPRSNATISAWGNLTATFA